MKLYVGQGIEFYESGRPLVDVDLTKIGKMGLTFDVKIKAGGEKTTVSVPYDHEFAVGNVSLFPKKNGLKIGSLEVSASEGIEFGKLLKTSSRNFRSF